MSLNLNELSKEQLIAHINQMKIDSARKLSCKVSEKGGVSVYGLGRFPVTLYQSQWDALIAFAKSGAIERFMATNSSLLSSKD